MSAGSGLGLALEVLAAEGPVAFRDRLLDRLAGWRRRRGFETVAAESPGGEAPEPLVETPVLNVLATAPRPDFGGVQVQLLRRLAAEAAGRPIALLYPEGGGYRLEVETPGRRFAVLLNAPPSAPAAFEDPAFEWAVEAAARRVGARAVHFEQPAGFPLGSVGKLRAAGLELVLSVHDFGLFCPRPHLVERPKDAFCHFSRDAERCHRCLSHDWDVDLGFQEARRRAAGELLQASAAAIYPSGFLRRAYRRLFAGLDPARQHVVEPPSAGGPAPPAASGASGRLGHVAYVGSVQPHKGALVFEEVLRRLARARPRPRFSVYGGGDAEILRRLRRLGARIRGYYRADRLPELLRRDGVDLALLPSIWPESYALTFDECLRAGVPVLAFDHGAIADRVRRLGGGELVDPAAGAAGLAERLAELIESGALPVSLPSDLPDGTSAARATGEIYRRLGLSS